MEKYNLGKNVKNQVFWDVYKNSYAQITNKMNYDRSKSIDSDVRRHMSWTIMDKVDHQICSEVQTYVILESVRYGL
jgi:hypothetical protein